MGYTPPFLEVRKLSGYYSVLAPSSVSTDDLRIYANTVNTLPYLEMIGAGGFKLNCTNGYGLEIYQAAPGVYGKIYYTDPDFLVESQIADKNIYLKTAGTGVVKFGTYAAGAAADSTGYITILDAAGNTRKLMVQA